ncbi:hypothetical protein PRZ48_010061 [Zasmidium cellare]|uniref:N-acetyltransferase domain-containing protein n=1 Tax=Zasmidium cellare TaxID=395010 RepID=A0ABR0EEH7_ZASCE|nr:hypothetical protein PRZ48_010061 [Zasmidium cellare]
MPRDLSAMANENTLSGMSGLSKSNKATNIERETAMDATDNASNTNDASSATPRDEIHPYCQTLSLSDVDSCTRLEEATFPPQERCTREKFEYRLRNCGELSMGIFTSLKDPDLPTGETSAPVYSGAPERKAVLLGHIVATKTTTLVVTDEDMAYPTAENPDPKLGHKEEGRTVCIHSLAILPQYQGKGLGKTLLKAYLQRIENQSVADNAALIAHEHLIPYYEKLGFENKGQSKAQFGGGGWYDMVKQLQPSQNITS